MARSPLNAGDLFDKHRTSEGTALTDTSGSGAPRRQTYRELDDACNAVARGLRRAGLAAGDRVAILSLNRREFVETFFGAMRAGCVPVPINIRLPDQGIGEILADAEVKLAFADEASATSVTGQAPVVGFDDHSDSGYARFQDPGPFESLRPGEESLALLPYTSGSTGSPKGVMLSHRGVIWNNRTVARARGLSPQDRSLIAAPLFHKNGLNTLKQTLTAGGEAVLMERFDAESYLRVLMDHRCTLLGGVPTMFVRILREIADLDDPCLSFVKRIGFGSAPASDSLIDDLRRPFPAAIIENNYGITEGGPVIFGPHPKDLPRPDNSVGYPLPDVEVRLGRGEPTEEGLLHVRNPGVMLGYHGNPEATAKRLAHGWLDTGDIFRRDEQGFYFFVGRNDDMFVCGGENLYPGEVATVLEKHPAVLQAAVVPLADEDKGSIPCAFVVKRPGVAVDADDIKNFALSNGPAYAHPRTVVFVDNMPLTGNAKIDLAALKARLPESASLGVRK